MPIVLAIFQQQLVSLSRAAELAGLGQWDFRAILKQHMIEINVEVAPSDEMDAIIARFKAAQQ